MIRTFLFAFVAAAGLSTATYASIVDWDDHKGGDDKYSDHDPYHKHDHDKDDWKISYNDHDADDRFYGGDWDGHGKKGHDDYDDKYDHDKGHDYDHDPKWKIAECNVGRHDHDHDWDFDYGHHGKHCDPGGSVSSVPLPPALLMFNAALLALGAIAWCRRRAKA